MTTGAKKFRALLESGEFIVSPGVYDGYSIRLVEGPRERAPQRGPGVDAGVGVAEPFADLGDGAARRRRVQGVQQPSGLGERTQSHEGAEPLAQRDDDLGLVVVVAVQTLRCVARDSGALLPREALPRLVPRGVRLDRQRGCRGQQFQQERQRRAPGLGEGDVERASVRRPRRAAGVVAVPDLGLRSPRRRTPLQSRDQRRGAPGVVARLVGDRRQHAPSLEPPPR